MVTSIERFPVILTENPRISGITPGMRFFAEYGSLKRASLDDMVFLVHEKKDISFWSRKRFIMPEIMCYVRSPFPDFSVICINPIVRKVKLPMHFFTIRKSITNKNAYEDFTTDIRKAFRFLNEGCAMRFLLNLKRCIAPIFHEGHEFYITNFTQFKK